MIVDRKEITDYINKSLDEWGHGKTIDQSWGSMIFSFVFEKGRIVLKARERETEKRISSEH